MECSKDTNKSEWKCKQYIKMQVLRLKIPLLIQYQGSEDNLKSKFLSDQTQLMLFLINHIYMWLENKLPSVCINSIALEASGSPVSVRFQVSSRLGAELVCFMVDWMNGLVGFFFWLQPLVFQNQSTLVMFQRCLFSTVWRLTVMTAVPVLQRACNSRNERKFPFIFSQLLDNTHKYYEGKTFFRTKYMSK